MKKNLILLLALIILTGCSTAKSLTEKNPPTMPDNINDQQTIDKINATEEDLISETTPKDSTAKTENDNQQQTTQNQQQSPRQNKEETDDKNPTIQHSQAIIKTNLGNITVKFYQKEAPMAVNNFIELSKKGFYNGTKFHRVIKGFMIQGGDPLSRDNNWSDDGRGGPGYYFPDEINEHKLIKGSLAMANSGPNTNGSQFFIVTAESAPWLDDRHTNFGYVAEGMEVVEKIENTKVNQNDHPTNDIMIKNIELK